MALLLLFLFLASASQAASFQFVVLGDRTGEAQPEVYEQIWRDIRAQSPAFVISVGDTIQGGNNATAAREWREAQRIVTPAWWKKLYLSPGNHDIWSPESEQLFRQYAAHPPHYSFDFRQIHFTVLDNSRTEELDAGEMKFLEADLRAHAEQPMKFIISHRPSWIFEAMLHNPEFPLGRLATKYNVQFVIAGHIHEMMRMKIGKVTYISMVSSGGHLRTAKNYDTGWFFGYGIVTVDNAVIRYEIKELKEPFGNGRTTPVTDWGSLGFANKVP